MNKKQMILVYIISLIIVNNYSSTAQTSIGTGFGINFPLISSNHFGNLVKSDTCYCNQLPGKNTVDVSPYVYVEIAHNIGDFLGLQTLLHLNVGYVQNVWSEKAGRGPNVPSRFNSPIAETFIDWETKNSLHFVNSQLGILLRIPDADFDVSVDFSLSSLVSSKALFTYSLVYDPEQPAQFTATPEELAANKFVYGFSPYYLNEEMTSIVLYDKEAPEINTFRFGFNLGLRKEFTVFDVPIIPSISYQYLPQMISKYESASINNLSIGLGTKILL